jgi:sugar lactone lactonase YvrE
MLRAMRRWRWWILGVVALVGLCGLAWTLFSKSIRRHLRGTPEAWAGRFQDPEGMAVDAEGNVYIADEDRGIFTMVDRDGKTVAQLKNLNGLEGPLTSGDSMVILSPGHVVAIGLHNLVEFEIGVGGGKLVRVVGSRGPDPGQFEDPEGISRDASGELYVTDEDHRRVMVFDREGKFARLWKVPDDPESVCVHGDRVYVTFSKANYVSCYDRQGAFKFKFGSRGSGPGEFHVPDYVCVSPDGKLYVTDQKNDRIQVFDLDGRFLFAFGGSGQEHGRFNDPEDLAFDREGNLYVADGGNHRIQVLTPQGKPIRTIE